MSKSSAPDIIPNPTEQLSVQDRILEYATHIGWQLVSRSDAEQFRGFDNTQAIPKDRAKNASWFFDDVLFQKVKEFNPAYEYTKEELVRTLSQHQGFQCRECFYGSGLCIFIPLLNFFSLLPHRK